MKRRLLFAGMVGALTVAAWSLGSAQARVADFYITVDAPTGELKVTCSKGCDWRNDQGNAPTDTLVSRCASQPCRLMLNGQGRITLGQPLGR